jgi:hypothetical protein
MNASLRFALAGCLAVVCGCRSQVSHELLERELLAQENQIYHLQDLVDEYEARLDSCRRENDSLLAESSPSRTSGKRSTAPLRRDTDELAPPVVEPGPDEPVLPYDGPPVISPPDARVPEGDPTVGGPKLRLPRGGALRPASTAGGPIDEVVVQITLNRKLTGGHNVDGHPGDEGVMVVVEPLDADGGLLEVPGAVSIVVLDPEVEGESARVARWDFSAKEAAEYIKRTPLGDGLHFDLRWPHSPPVHRVLNLYVRYTTADGRRLQVEKQIEVDPPGGTMPETPLTEDPPPTVADAKNDPAKTVRLSPVGNETTETAPRDGKGASAQKPAPRWAPYR